MTHRVKNILFIMCDQLRWDYLSCSGHPHLQTPNIDRIAKEGTRFANSFVNNSICTPSRATLLTGQYSHLNGVPAFNRFDGARDNVAKHLQAGGYHTGMIGKWHLGSDPTGFDRWIVLPGQGVLEADIQQAADHAHGAAGVEHMHHTAASNEAGAGESWNPAMTSSGNGRSMAECDVRNPPNHP